jgi:hypothetical protein
MINNPIWRRAPREAVRAFDRANAMLDVQMSARAQKPAGKVGVWQSLLAILERADEAKQIANEAKDAADKAARPSRTKALQIIRSKSE